jgi:excinuclease ABC subunit C
MSRLNYQKQVDAIRNLKGNFKESMKDFKRVMIELARYAFEEAQNQRENRSFRKLSIAINHCKSKTLNIDDVFSIVSESAAYVNFLQIAMVRSFVRILWRSRKN